MYIYQNKTPMKSPLKLLTLISIITLSCKSQRTENPMSIPKGYMSGLLSIVEDSPCKYQFKIETSEETFDLVNAEEKFADVKLKNGQTLALKILRLRRSNRCENLLPVEVLDVISQ